MRHLLFSTVLFFTFGCAATAFAAELSSPLPLWPAGAPGALGDKPQDIPTLTLFPPKGGNVNGASILIFPGGGYGHLAAHEGLGYAQWLADHGFTCYVLQYRLGTHGYRHPVMLNDAARALRMVRSFALKDKTLDPARVGVMGSSAGGHLAATLVTHFDVGDPTAADPIDRVSSRPDLGILCYPVITMLDPHTHSGSRKQLLGESPSDEMLRELSNELKVSPQTPPCFIWHTVEDKAVPVENALMFASALRAANVPFALHVYEKGAHGLGLGRPGRPAPPWAEQLLYWLRERQFVQ